MSHKVVSSASAVGGQSLRNRPMSNRVGSKRTLTVIERLREQIRCIERRAPTLDPAKRAPVPALGQDAIVANGLSADRDQQAQGVCGTTLFCKPVPDQAGVSAARFANEDGGVCSPNMSPPPPSSSLSALAEQVAALRKPTPSRNNGQAQAVWTLGATSETEQVDAFDADAFGSDRSCSGMPRTSLAQLALDEGGVHEIKPAGPLGSAEYYDSASDGFGDWASAWGAARSLALAMIARRRQRTSRPILWCMPRNAKAEHGRLYSRGLRRFGLTPADVLIVETGNPQETLWVLEEGLKSESLALVAGLIDDVALTPARRLALAAQKHHTPCLLLTHPRMPPIGATATRWRVAAAPGAPHVLSASRTAGASHTMGASHAAGVSHTASAMCTTRTPHVHFNGLGARRLALTLERYRAAPAHLTGRERIMEWSDEAVCLRLVADVSDRSDAARVPARGAASTTVRAG